MAVFSFIFKILLAIFWACTPSAFAGTFEHEQRLQEEDFLLDGYDLLPGSDIRSKQQLGQGTLFESKKYWIFSEEMEYELGSHIFILKRESSNPPSVSKIKSTSSFALKERTAEYFYGIYNDYLFIDGGTGPHPRRIVIYYIPSATKIYEGYYSLPVTVAHGIFSFWSITGPGTLNKCPEMAEWQKEGLRTAIEHRFIYILDLSHSQITSDRRCTAHQ